jgi:hypothetical protein
LTGSARKRPQAFRDLLSRCSRRGSNKKCAPMP